MAPLERALALQAGCSDTLFHLAKAWEALSHLPNAEEHLRAAIRVSPSHTEALLQLGILLEESQRFKEALAFYQALLASQPDHFIALCNSANCLQHLEQFDEALSYYEKALTISPDHAVALSNLGVVYHKLERFDKAILCFEKGIRSNPQSAELFLNAGVSILKSRQPTKALTHFEKAISLRSGYLEAHLNKAIALEEFQRYPEACESLTQAISASPQAALAYATRAYFFAKQNRLTEAIADLEKAICLQPEDVPTHVLLAVVSLLSGDYARGWQESEWRWKRKENAPVQRNLPGKLWLGTESLEGKTLFVHFEQGLGDSIQFCRLLSLLQGKAGKVVFEVQGSLLPLLADLPGTHQTIAHGDPIPPYDFFCPLMSLPLAFRIDLSNLPAPQSYLHACPHLLRTWQQRLGPKKRPRVGLAWSGNPQHPDDANRSASLQSLLPWLPAELEWIVIQKEIRPEDQAFLQNWEGVRLFPEELTNFSQTAALLSCLDLVLTVDTSLAHLGGALGIPTWIMVPFFPDWRWLLHRTDSPWYPSVRLYRQLAFGDWKSLFEPLQRDLQQLAHGSAFPCSS